MKILLHMCCGPCAVYPVTVLRRQGHELTGFFHNPNIHPFREFRRRLGAAAQFSEAVNLPVVWDRQYGLRQFLRAAVFHEDERCRFCYEMRLRQTATRAAALGLDGFTTTLLYSRYQKHDLIRQVAERAAAAAGTYFLYEDFRVGWQEGIDGAIAMDLYRQPYCGCIYSEQERYDKKLRKKGRGGRPPEAELSSPRRQG